MDYPLEIYSKFVLANWLLFSQILEMADGQNLFQALQLMYLL